MKNAVAKTIVKCFDSYHEMKFNEWLQQWPTQMVLIVLDIKTTRDLSEVFEKKRGIQAKQK